MDRKFLKRWIKKELKPAVKQLKKAVKSKDDKLIKIERG
jgi:hypothetical protein